MNQISSIPAQFTGVFKSGQMRQRTIIVEDDRASASRLSTLLTSICPAIDIVGIAHDSASAMKQLQRTDLDLAFLDVELDGQSSLEMLPALDHQNFKIIFVSASDRHALPAIKVSAVDYLLKPVDPVELSCCYRKLMGYSGPEPMPEQVPATGERKLILRQGDQVYIKRVDDIVFMKASGFYTQIYFYHHDALRNITISKPMHELESDWQHPKLLRVHRSFIVNVNFVRQVRRTDGCTQLLLETGAQIPVARRRMTAFMDQYSA